MGNIHSAFAFLTEVGGCGAPLVTTEMTDLHGLRLDGSA